MHSLNISSYEKDMGKKDIEVKNEGRKLIVDSLVLRCDGRSNHCWERAMNELISGQ